MKKLTVLLSSLFLACLMLTSCGGPSWNQQRAQELYDKPFEELTADDFDEMCDLIEGGWVKFKSYYSEPGRTANMTDEDREFSRLFFNLDSRARSMAHATKRVVSDAQSAAYDEMAERIKKEYKEL